MTKQVAYKILLEFWCWYGDVVKTVTRFTDDEHEMTALDEVGKHSFDGLPSPSLDAKFSICGKEFEVRDALSLASITIEQVVNEFPDNPDVPSVRVKSELLPLLFSRFQGIFENDYKKKRELHFVVTPSLSRIRTNGLEPSRCYSLEPETSASTNSATCAFDWCERILSQSGILCKRILQKN